MLDVVRLTVRTGAFLLSDVSLAISAGECHVVVGPSGSGKSTLLAAILGLVPVTSGAIHLDGREITRLPIEQRRLGYVPQHLGLFPHLCVRDNLLYGVRARRVPECEYRPLLDRLLAVTDISALLDRRIVTLSGGERQRVALVRALIANPRLVLLDEPFAALNASLRHELWWLLKDLQRERGLTLLMVTHDLTEAYFLADRITVLIDGRHAQSGDKGAVYRRPASEAVARFFGLRNLFPARRIDHGSVECPALGGRLALCADGITDSVVLLAIRPEHVALRHADDPLRPGETRLHGRFESVVDLGEVALLNFRCDSGALLEARCGSRTLCRYGIRAGQPGWVGLPASDLFILPCAAA